MGGGEEGHKQLGPCAGGELGMLGCHLGLGVGAKKREDGGWCGWTEGMAGGPESVDEGPCTIPLSKSLGKILSGGVT